MKTSQEFIALLREHQSELQQQFGIVSMRLFGSVARGDHREDESWGQVPRDSRKGRWISHPTASLI